MVNQNPQSCVWVVIDDDSDINDDDCTKEVMRLVTLLSPVINSSALLLEVAANTLRECGETPTALTALIVIDEVDEKVKDEVD